MSTPGLEHIKRQHYASCTSPTVLMTLQFERLSDSKVQFQTASSFAAKMPRGCLGVFVGPLHMHSSNFKCHTTAPTKSHEKQNHSYMGSSRKLGLLRFQAISLCACCWRGRQACPSRPAAKTWTCPTSLTLLAPTRLPWPM